MDKGRHIKHRQHAQNSEALGVRFEYDRADEKRKIQEEIEEFLEERTRKEPSEER